MNDLIKEIEKISWMLLWTSTKVEKNIRFYD